MDEKSNKKTDRKDNRLDYDCASGGNRDSLGSGHVCNVRAIVLD